MQEYKNRMNEILQKIEEDTRRFLEENPSLEFYSVGFDCSSEYARILLCFNTEDAFQDTLKQYQKKYGDSYKSEESVCRLRFNTGDWEYQGVSEYTIFSGEELLEMYKDDYKEMAVGMKNIDYQFIWNFCLEEMSQDEHEKICTDMMDFNRQLMLNFCKTQCFKSIPKTENFQPICIDHDEDELDALKRTKQVLQSGTFQEI